MKPTKFEQLLIDLNLTYAQQTMIKDFVLEEIIGDFEEQPDFERLPQLYDTTDLLLERNALRDKQYQLVTSKDVVPIKE